MRKVLQWFIVAALVAASIFLAFTIHGERCYHRGYDDALASIKPDTVYIDNTIHYDKPEPDTVYRDTGRVVYVPVIVKDSTGHVDTTNVPMHPEVKQYGDSTYRAQVSGIDPNLDWIEVYQRTFYITKVVPEYKYPTFALSPAISANLFPGSFGIGGGLDVDYWYKRWQFSAEGGYAVNFTNTMNTGFYAKGTVKYNLILR